MRRPKNVLARHLLRLIEWLEALHGFATASFYTRTYHNDVADWITREVLIRVREELAEARWALLEAPEEWGRAAAGR